MGRADPLVASLVELRRELDDTIATLESDRARLARERESKGHRLDAARAVRKAITLAIAARVDELELELQRQAAKAGDAARVDAGEVAP